jgi:hypothetical protein
MKTGACLASARLTAVLIAATMAAATIGASPAGAVEDCAGVTVVVDAIDAGGQVTARCVLEADDGLEALVRAGHTYTFLARNPGFVCTIDRIPDPCNGAPTDAYWSYWIEGDDGWAYAPTGAGFRRPPTGSVEGWRFGDGSEPPRIEAAADAAAAPEAASAEERPPSRGSAVLVTVAIVVVLGVLAWWRR